MVRIGLVKSTFYKEPETKQALVEYIAGAKTLSMGEQVFRFEEAFARKQGRKFAVMVNSGSSANLVLLQALLNLGRLTKGDSVGFSALTWATNVMPIIQLGLTPVGIGCERDTLNISPRKLEPYISQIKCLFLTNVLGFSDDISTVREMCQKQGVLLLEDNCESLGSSVAGTLLGNFSLASTFSFFVGHHMSTIEGGMICTDDEELAHMLIMVRAHGWGRSLPEARRRELQSAFKTDDFYALYTFYDLAYNVRPTDIQGFLGLTQLPYWDEMVRIRESNFMAIKSAMDGNSDFLPLRTEHMDIISNFAVPVIARDTETFGRYKERFKEAGVEVRPVIAGNIVVQPFYKKYISECEECLTTSFVHKNGFYFGNNPELTPEELGLFLSLVAQPKKRRSRSQKSVPARLHRTQVREKIS